MNKTRVLVVDDDRTTNLAIKTIAGDRFEVVTVESAEEALEALASDNFEIIISDYKLPRLSGVELLANAQTLQPDAVRMLMTGVSDVKVVVDAVNLGKIYHYLHKPFTRVELLSALNSAKESHANTLAHQVELQDTLSQMRQQMAELQRAVDNLPAKLNDA